MSLIPAFEIGIRNAWILTVYLLLVSTLPPYLIDANKAKKLENWPPYTKFKKILALATHVFIMPVVALYSIFFTTAIKYGLVIYRVTCLFCWRNPYAVNLHKHQ